MATFEELHQSILALAKQLDRDWQDHRFDDALTTVDDIKGDLDQIEKIVAQRFAGETS